MLRKRQATFRARFETLASMMATQEEFEATQARLAALEAKVDAGRREGRRRSRKLIAHVDVAIRKAFRAHDEQLSKTRWRVAQWGIVLLLVLLSTSNDSPVNPWMLLKTLGG